MRFTLWSYIVLIYIIFCFLFTSYYTRINEAFTPSIRKMYRPYVRKARLHSEGFIHRGTNDASRLFKKIGIL